MKVLIVPEDPTHDQFILKPVVERIFRDLQISARVDVLRDPHLRGVDEALDRQTVAEIIADNHMIDLFLVMVDQDCNRYNNRERAKDREAEHREALIWTGLLGLCPEIAVLKQRILGWSQGARANF